MSDSNSDGDPIGSISFLDGSASLRPAGNTIDGRPQRPKSPGRVALMDPATSVMTDFTWDPRFGSRWRQWAIWSNAFSAGETRTSWSSGMRNRVARSLAAFSRAQSSNVDRADLLTAR